MKIALVSPYDWATPGGVNRHVSNLAEQFIKAGHQATVIAPASKVRGNEPEYVTILGESTFGLPASGSVANICLSYDLGPRVKDLCAKEQFDIVHVHEPFMPLLPFQFLRYSQATNLATFHAAREGGSRLYAYSKFIIRPWWDRIHARIAHSRSSLRLIGKHFAARYRIIPSGIDCAFYENAAPMPELTDGKRNILFLGRLEKRKGLPYLLEAFVDVKRAFPDTRLVVVGGDGGLLAPAQRYVERQRLDDVIFTGFVREDDKPRYLKSAHVYCAPNTGAESLGIVLLEAMSAGAPIVASGIDGFVDVVTGGHEGLLVPPRDSGALAEALKRVLVDGPLRDQMGRHAAKTAQTYNWDRITGQVLCYYEETMAGRAAAGA